MGKLDQLSFFYLSTLNIERKILKYATLVFFDSLDSLNFRGAADWHGYTLSSEKSGHTGIGVIAEATIVMTICSLFQMQGRIDLAFKRSNTIILFLHTFIQIDAVNQPFYSNQTDQSSIYFEFAILLLHEWFSEYVRDDRGKNV